MVAIGKSGTPSSTCASHVLAAILLAAVAVALPGCDAATRFSNPVRQQAAQQTDPAQQKHDPRDEQENAATASAGNAPRQDQYAGQIVWRPRHDDNAVASGNGVCAQALSSLYRDIPLSTVNNNMSEKEWSAYSDADMCRQITYYIDDKRDVPQNLWRAFTTRFDKAEAARIGQSGKELKDADPLSGVGALADAKLQSWLKSGLPLFTGEPPQKPSPPPLPPLTKGEFEQTTAFQARVSQAEQGRAETIRALARSYERQVRDYNSAIAAHNEALRQEIERRQRDLPVMRARFLSETLAERLGNPRIKDLKYDADSETFFGNLVATQVPFGRPIALRVPLAEGPAVKASVSDALPTVVFKVDGGRLSIAQIKILVIQKTFDATIADPSAAPVAVVATVRDEPMNIPDLPKASLLQADIEGLIDENHRHFATVSGGGGADPAMEALRQREAEAARKVREAEGQRAAEAERQRLLSSIKTQEERLQQLQLPGVATSSDAKGLVPLKQWAFRPASVPARDLIAVVIGNRNYAAGIAKVSYAHNDAKAMRQFVETTLGVPKENIIFELDATKGTMEGIFQSRLPNLIEKDRTGVLVYYSGHGMPVGDDARLMPVDSRPDTAKVTGYSRQELLEQLGRLGARDVTVILDACFTGSSAAGPLLASAKPILLRPVRDTALPSNGLLITASRGDEVSWVDDTAGMSLLTLHLLEVLSGGADTAKTGRVDATAINAYLAETVDRHARRDWNQPQHPQVMGNNRTIVQY